MGILFMEIKWIQFITEICLGIRKALPGLGRAFSAACPPFKESGKKVSSTSPPSQSGRRPSVKENPPQPGRGCLSLGDAFAIKNIVVIGFYKMLGSPYGVARCAAD